MLAVIAVHLHMLMLKLFVPSAHTTALRCSAYLSEESFCSIDKVVSSCASRAAGCNLLLCLPLLEKAMPQSERDSAV